MEFVSTVVDTFDAAPVMVTPDSVWQPMQASTLRLAGPPVDVTNAPPVNDIEVDCIEIAPLVEATPPPLREIVLLATMETEAP